MANRMTSEEYRRRFLRGIERGLTDVAHAIEEEGSRIIAAEAMDHGELLGSSETRTPAPGEREVAWTARHAAAQEFGARAHWPPFEPILDWVKRNLHRTGTDDFEFKGPSGRRVRASKKFDIRVKEEGKLVDRTVMAHPEHMRAARAVQAKIAKEGLKPVAYARRAVTIVRPRVATLLAAGIKAELGGGA